MSHVLFVGRWQPCHLGHVALWRAGAWDHRRPAVVYVRDIKPDKCNPFTTEQTVKLIRAAFRDEGTDAAIASRVMVGPDIEAIRYGRGVGYAVEEVTLPGDVQAISATDIRRQVQAGMTGWREMVTPTVAGLLLQLEW